MIIANENDKYELTEELPDDLRNDLRNSKNSMEL